jgi:hypothetical protein
VLLCFVMWRGPVPCIHHHAGEAAEGVIGTELSRHLAIYEHDGSESGWHFHFVFPWTSHETDAEGDRGSTSDPVIAGRLLLPDIPVGDAFAAHCHGVPQAAVAAPLADNPAHEESSRPVGEAATFCGSLLASGPLCAVIGVALS